MTLTYHMYVDAGFLCWIHFISLYSLFITFEMRHGRFCINTPNLLSVFSTHPSFSYTSHFHIHHHYHHHHHHHIKNIHIIMATLSPSHTQALIATTITGLGVLCIIPLTTIADIMIPHIVFFYIILHSSSDKPSRLAL